MWTRRKLLIWGTTYPEFSRTYFETVCTGAIDGETGRLVRIYPLTLRHMQEPFAHYQWIEAEIAPNSSDFRPESHKIRQDSIRVLHRVGTDNGWAERSQWVLNPSNVFGSIENLLGAEERDHISLGVVRPASIDRIYACARTRADRADWEHHRDLALAQKDLFVDPESQVRELRFRDLDYRIRFRCSDRACKGHDMSVLDWGLYNLHRRMARQHGKDLGQKKVIQKLEEICDATKKNVHFYLGNTKAHTQSFMIVGLYYPPLEARARRTGQRETQTAFAF